MYNLTFIEDSCIVFNDDPRLMFRQIKFYETLPFGESPLNMLFGECVHINFIIFNTMKYLRFSIIPFLVLFLVSCSGSSNNDTNESTEESSSSNSGGIAGALGSLAKNLEDAAKAAEDLANKNIEPVDFRTLTDMLPTNAAGLDQVDKSGEKSGISGMATSFAEARYEDAEGNKRITMKITDVGSMTSLVAFGMAWMNMVIDKESTSGYERTTKVDGHPALEKFEQGEGYSNGEITVVIANRYIVEAKGNGITMSNLKDALGSVDLSKLASMKDEGVTAAN